MATLSTPTLPPSLGSALPDPGSPADPLGPAASNGAGRWRMIRRFLAEGGPGFCQFAINNACNAGCQFCSFNLQTLPRADWAFVPLPEACRAITILHRSGVRYLVITGGEPMLHPNLNDLIRFASGQGMVVLLVTNGSRLTPSSIQALNQSGLSSILISIDAASVRVHEEHRKLPNVCERIRQANGLFKQLGIQSTASVTMSRLIEDYAALPPFLRDLGFDAVTFSYPLTSLNSSFLGHAESPLVSYDPDALSQAFDEVKRLKRTFSVVNPTASLEEMQRFLRNEPQRFPCLGGYKYFYLDWNLLLWRCHFWETPLCSIFEFDETRRVRDGCTRCMIDCYRDASVMQHVAVAVADSWRHARERRWRAASRSLFARSVLESVNSLVEQLRWITRL